MTEAGSGKAQLHGDPSLSAKSDLSAKSVLQDAVLPSLPRDVHALLNEHLFGPKAEGIDYDDALVSLQLVLAKVDAKGLQPRHMAWPSLAASIALLADTSAAGLKARARCGWSHREMLWALEMDMYGYNCGRVTNKRFARCLPCAVGKPGKCGGASAAWFCRRRLTTRDTRDVAPGDKKAVLAAERTTLLPSRSDGHILARGLDPSGNPAGPSRKSKEPPPGPEEDERVSAFDRGTWSGQRLEGGEDDKSETFVAQARALLDSTQGMPVLDKWTEVNVATTKRYVGCLKRLAGKDSAKRKRIADGTQAMTAEQLRTTELKRWPDFSFLLGGKEADTCLPEVLRERSACFLNMRTREWAAEMQPLVCGMPQWYLRAGSDAAEVAAPPLKRTRTSSRSPSVPQAEQPLATSLTGGAVRCTQQLAVAPLDLRTTSAPTTGAVSGPATPDLADAGFFHAAGQPPPLAGPAAVAATSGGGGGFPGWYPLPLSRQAQASKQAAAAVAVAHKQLRQGSGLLASEPDTPPTPANQNFSATSTHSAAASHGTAASLRAPPRAPSSRGSGLLSTSNGFGSSFLASEGGAVATGSRYGGKAPRSRSGSFGGGRAASASLDAGDASVACLPSMGRAAASSFLGGASSGAGPSGLGRCDFGGSFSDVPFSMGAANFGSAAASAWYADGSSSRHDGPADTTPADDNAIFAGYLDDYDVLDLDDLLNPPSPMGGGAAFGGAGPSSGWGATMGAPPPAQAAENALTLQSCLLDDASMHADLHRSGYGGAAASAAAAAGSSSLAHAGFDMPPPRHRAASAAAATAHAGFDAPGHHGDDLGGGLCSECVDKEETCPACQRFLEELLVHSASPAPLEFCEPAFAA